MAIDWNFSTVRSMAVAVQDRLSDLLFKTYRLVIADLLLIQDLFVFN